VKLFFLINISQSNLGKQTGERKFLVEDTNSAYVDIDEPIDIFKNAEKIRTLNEEVAEEDLFESAVPTSWIEGRENKCIAAIIAGAVVFLFFFF